MRNDGTRQKWKTHTHIHTHKVEKERKRWKKRALEMKMTSKTVRMAPFDLERSGFFSSATYRATVLHCNVNYSSTQSLLSEDVCAFRCPVKKSYVGRELRYRLSRCAQGDRRSRGGKKDPQVLPTHVLQRFGVVVRMSFLIFPSPYERGNMDNQNRLGYKSSSLPTFVCHSLRTRPFKKKDSQFGV